MAHGILRSKMNTLKLDVEVDSAGTSAYHIGDPPDIRQQETALSKGIDISDLRARQFTVQDFDDFDLIYAMDDSNYNNMDTLARDELDHAKLKMILNENNSEQYLSVPDPYYGGSDGFELVYQLLNDACEVIAKKIQDGSYR
jgi:protein-tyrosine phosphatase